MNRRKIKLLGIIGIILFVTTRFFCGVFEHDEFGDDVYFIKHKPTWKWRFKSPRGMSDLELDQMNEEQKEEQILFDEFVDKRISR